MIKKRWRQNIIRIIIAFFLLVLIVLSIFYFFPLPSSLVKPIISKAFSKSFPGLEINVERVRVTLVRQRARLYEIHIIDPETGDNYYVQSAVIEFKYPPLRATSIEINNPSRIGIHAPAKIGEKIVFDNSVLEKVFHVEKQGKLHTYKFHPIRLSLENGQSIITLSDEDETTRIIRIDNIQTTLDIDESSLMCEGLGMLNILDYENEQAFFRIAYSNNDRSLDVILKSSALFVPLRDEKVPFYALIDKFEASLAYSAKQGNPFLKVEARGKDVSIFSQQRVQNALQISDMSASLEMFIPAGDPDALYIQSFSYHDENTHINGSGTISDTRKRRFFDLNFSLSSKDHELFKQALLALSIPQKIDVVQTPKSSVKMEGALNGTLKPFVIADYSIRSAINSLEIEVPPQNRLFLKEISAGISKDKVTIERSKFQGEFGEIEINGVITLVRPLSAKSLKGAEYELYTGGDALGCIRGNINAMDERTPFVIDFDFERISPIILDFLKKQTLRAEFDYIDILDETLIAGKAQFRGCFTPFVIGYYAGNINAVNLGILLPDEESWYVNDVEIDLTPDRYKIKHLKGHSSTGNIDLSGELVKQAGDAEWHADFESSGTFTADVFLRYMKDILGNSPLALSKIENAIVTGDLFFRLKGETSITLVPQVEIDNLRFSSEIRTENMFMKIEPNDEPIKISADFDISEGQLIIDRMLAVTNSTSTTIQGRIFSETLFWERPQWDLSISGTTSIDRFTEKIMDISNNHISFSGNNALNYDLISRRELNQNSTIIDTVRLTAQAGSALLSIYDHNLSLEDIYADVRFKDSLFEIKSADARVNSCPVSLSGTISPNNLNLTLHSLLDLNILKETLHDLLAPMIMDGLTTVTLHLNHRMPEQETNMNVSTSLDYSQLGESYSKILRTFIEDIQNPFQHREMIRGEAILHNNTIYYYEFPVPVYDINGIARINGAKIDCQDFTLRCGNSSGIRASGTVDFSGDYPFITIKTFMEKFYLSEWTHGWNRLPEELKPRVKKAGSHTSKDIPRFHIRIDATGNELILKPLKGNEFVFKLSYVNYPGSTPNELILSGSRGAAYGGSIELKEGRLLAQKGKTEHTWSLQVDKILIHDLYSDIKHNESSLFGILSGEATIQGRESNLRLLSGSGSGNIRDCRFIKLPLFNRMADTISVSELGNPSFSNVTADFMIADETVNFKKMIFESPLIGLSAEGNMAFNEDVDFTIYLTLISGFARQLPIIGEISSRLLTRIEALGGYAGKLRLTGSLSNPEFRIIPFSIDEITGRFPSRDNKSEKLNNVRARE